MGKRVAQLIIESSVLWWAKSLTSSQVLDWVESTEEAEEPTVLPKGAVSPRETLLSLSCTQPFQKALPRELCPQPYGVEDPLVCPHM